MENGETWFTDGSSYVLNGNRHAGYAITTSQEVIESGALPMNTSAQKAEIIALTRALELAQGKVVNIYTDSKYAFGVVHAHGAIWKERGLLNSQGKNIKHAEEILKLLEAVQLPKKVAIMHIKAHQKVSSDLERGNELADREAKQVAKTKVKTEGALIPDRQISLEGKPEYTKEDPREERSRRSQEEQGRESAPQQGVGTGMGALPGMARLVSGVRWMLLGRAAIQSANHNSFFPCDEAMPPPVLRPLRAATGAALSPLSGTLVGLDGINVFGRANLP
ncbi:uncharacterized protein LOC128136028 [Harpia harpyja]|uniref:uncharacterized protein LOC128136028 n=1 Tax=Harpia harpyja TaxID=202280 RepID=UPI0022B14BB2|nr:uncharacterized protein LOC128136028 [Harpia harpyja]